MKQVLKNVCIIVFCLLIIFPVFNPVQASEVDTGNIIFLSGSVSVDGSPAKIGMVVKNASTVQTEKESICEIVFNEKNIIKIFPSSRVTLNLQAQERSIGMISGALAITVKKLGKLLNKEKFQLLVNTPTVVAGVRGTSFYVNCENSEETTEQTYFCVCNGVIHLKNPDGTFEQEIEAKHHRALRFSRKEETVLVEDAPMLYHMDADIEKMSAKIGVSIDWEIVDKQVE